jgi:hypothetical protein
MYGLIGAMNPWGQGYTQLDMPLLLSEEKKVCFESYFNANR